MSGGMKDRQSLIAQALTAAGRKQLAISMTQPLRRVMNYAGIGRSLFVDQLNNVWLCTSCWMSGRLPHETERVCSKCGAGTLEYDDVPDGTLWVFDDEWVSSPRMDMR